MLCGRTNYYSSKVYSRSQIVGFQKFSQPTYEGFYSQAQESSSKGQVAIENIDGVSYYTFELFRTIAIANKSGKTILNSIQGDIVIRKQTTAKPKNIFEQFLEQVHMKIFQLILKANQ